MASIAGLPLVVGAIIGTPRHVKFEGECARVVADGGFGEGIRACGDETAGDATARRLSG